MFKMNFPAEKIADLFRGVREARLLLESKAQVALDSCDYDKAFELSRQAQDRFLCNPDFRVQFPGGRIVSLRIGVRGKISEFFVGKLLVSSWKPDKKFYGYGRFSRSQGFVWSPGRDKLPKIEEFLQVFSDNPVEVLAVCRPDTNSCRFCHRRLSDPPSVWSGYGPYCAKYRGLPWGDVGPMRADFNSAEEIRRVLAREQKMLFQEAV
jgi:hypothetical protein